MMKQIIRTNKITSKEEDAEYDELYAKLRLILKDMEKYYQIDKIKSYSVYICDKGTNVFDIQADEIVFYDETHVINPHAMNIVSEIQQILTQIQNYSLKIDLWREIR